MSYTMRNLMRTSLAFVLVVAAGCQDTAGPDSLLNLDAEAALADYEAMDSVLTSRAWTGFLQAAAGMDAATMGAAPTAVVLSSVDLEALAAGDARGLAAAMADVVRTERSAAVQLISSANRGKTFIYDAESDSWLIDPLRTDAPATGVRFVIYEPDGGMPDPSNPIGHADLIDLGDDREGIALQLVVVEGDLTVIDYETTLTGADGAGRITIDGFAQNRRDRLDFGIDVRGSNIAGTERNDITFDLGIAAREFHVSGDLHGEKQDGSDHGAVDLTVRHNTRSFRVDVENESGLLSGFIDLNDRPFATVSGPEHQPVFTTPSGDPIRGRHALALLRIFAVTEDVFDLFEDLIEPIAGLVIIAIIL